MHVIQNSEYTTLEQSENDKPDDMSTAGQLEYQEYSHQSDGSLGIRMSDVINTFA